NLKLVVGRFGDVFRHRFGRAVRNVKRLRPACGQSPLERRRRLRDRRRGDGGTGKSHTCRFQKLTTFHIGSSPLSSPAARLLAARTRTATGHRTILEWLQRAGKQI